MTIDLDYDEYWFIADMVIRRGNNAIRKVRDTEAFLEEHKGSLTERVELYNKHNLANAKETERLCESIRLKLVTANRKEEE